MGKPTLAGTLQLVLRNEKQKLKKKRRKRSENMFFNYISDEG